MLHKILVFVLILPYLISSEPIELTDKTWRQMLHGQWMVEFYAPWCPACQQFKRVWSDFADAMLSKKMKVAAVDVDKYPSLSGRFRISALPTVFYVHDGVFRQYEGERSLRGLKHYVEYEEWQNTAPMSPSFSPDSLSMTVISLLFDLSVILRDTYSLLLEEYSWPSWLIYIVFGIAIIFIGIIIGFISLMIMDYCISIWYRFFRKTKKTDNSDIQKTVGSAESETSAQNDNNESLSSEESDTSEGNLNTSDVVAENEQSETEAATTTTTDQTLRQRRLKD